MCALQSFERETNGELRFDPEAFQLHVGQLYAGESDVVAAAYRMQSLVGPTRWGSGIGKTSEITRLVSEGGSVLDSSRLRRHVEALFRSPDFTKKVPGMLENLLREEQNALEERLASLNLSEGQSDRPRRTSALNQTQRDFLYGNGQTSEAVTRRRRIEILSTLLRRARAGEDILGAH